jgi:SAM-dependent methyltransferase
MKPGADYYDDPRIAEAYDVDSPGLEGDAAFYAGLAQEAAASGQEVLELAVGTGRVAIPIARAGVRVTGLDRSPAMLEVARRKAEDVESLTLIEGDMADFDLGREFGLVYIPYRSFLHLMTIEAQKSCLRCVREHLVSGGRFALNFFNPDIAAIGDWLGPKRGSLQRLEAKDVSDGGKREVWSSRRYLTGTQQLDETRIEERLAPDGAVVSRVYRRMGLRYVFRYEMQHLLELSGFEVEALYGGFEQEPFTDTSAEMVWVARSR